MKKIKKIMNNEELKEFRLMLGLFGGTCACDYSGNDEWLPQYCDFAETNCPNVVGVACWEQYLKHMDRKEGETNE